MPEQIRAFLDTVDAIAITAASQDGDVAQRQLAQIALEVMGGIPPRHQQAATWEEWKLTAGYTTLAAWHACIWHARHAHTLAHLYSNSGLVFY
eukprot:SAG31_NODE_20044_length_585_cov_0.886831_1_plen_93_part_00